MKRMTMTMGAVAVGAITGVADPAIIFFDAEDVFSQALVDAGKFLKGIEDFEQANLPPSPNNFVFLNDPLNINNLQGAFNPGDFIDNLTFQSNTNGTDVDNDPGVNGLNPRGVDAVSVFGPGVFGTTNVGVLNNNNADSFDIISGPPAGGNHTALGMHVFTLNPAPTVEVRVFDKNEQQIGLIPMQTDFSGSFLGILATGGETIGRVNIWTVDGTGAGVYDVQTYIIPAPSALALLGLAGLFVPRRRRR